ncbi:MAG: hypothetical protein OXR62_07995 [Ahrensia sp.]|nr:hypothetical protein [Ahrensia sp.]
MDDADEVAMVRDGESESAQGIDRKISDPINPDQPRPPMSSQQQVGHDPVVESEFQALLKEQMEGQSAQQAEETSGDDYLSARVLKLRDKQTTCAELKGQIADGTAILRDLAAKADLLNRYLDAAEVDLTQLEATENASEKLTSFNRTLSQQYEEAKETLEEQQTRLDFMEAEKAKSRNTIEMARKEIARLLETKREQSVEINQGKALLAKTENDRANLIEKLETAERVQREQAQERDTLIQRIQQFEALRKQSEKTIAALRTKNDELEDELQRSAVGLSDLRLKHSDANSRVLALQTQLEEMSHELSGFKREAENSARLKEKRIVELESRLTSGVERQPFETVGDFGSTNSPIPLSAAKPAEAQTYDSQAEADPTEAVPSQNSASA